MENVNVIKLELTPDQIDLILGALGDQPFIKVNELIMQIRTQAVPQWQAIREAQNPKTESKEQT